MSKPGQNQHKPTRQEACWGRKPNGEQCGAWPQKGPGFKFCWRHDPANRGLHGACK